jgi:DNA recombination protein Rad52
MFTDTQLAQLAQDLPRDRVKTRAQAGQTLSYVDGHHAISRANEVFGADGWSYELREQVVVMDSTRKTERGENRVLVVRTTVRVRVHTGGEGEIVREDVGIGTCDQSVTTAHMGIEKAFKEAATDGLKRALRTFGASFGLALYDKSQSDVGMSFEAQDLLASVEQIAPDTVAHWTREHMAVIEALPADERTALGQALRARKALAAATAPQLGAPSVVGPLPPPESASIEDRLWTARLAAMPALSGRDLLTLASDLTAYQGTQVRALRDAYGQRWATLLAGYDAATRATVVTKLAQLPEALRFGASFDPVAAVLRTHGLSLPSRDPGADDAL